MTWEEDGREKEGRWRLLVDAPTVSWRLSPLMWCIWGDPSLRQGQAAMACRVCSTVTTSVVVPSVLSRSARPFWPAPQLESAGKAVDDLCLDLHGRYAYIAGVVFVLRGAVGFFVPGIDYPHPTLSQQVPVLVAGTTSPIGSREGRFETDEEARLAVSARASVRV